MLTSKPTLDGNKKNYKSLKMNQILEFLLRLEPILARIKEKRTAILCPTIDSIDDKNMAYKRGGSAGYGIFTWSLFFTWG